TESKNTGDKTISVTPRKPLGLKRGVERDTVRQSFSHGRTNTVQVERKKRRVVAPGEARVETPAPQPARPAASEPSAPPPPRPAPPAREPAATRPGVVLRQLSGEELDARARALADARVHEAEERKAAAELAARRAEEAERLAREHEEAERRKAEEDARRKAEEALRERAEDTARRHFGEEE